MVKPVGKAATQVNLVLDLFDVQRCATRSRASAAMHRIYLIQLRHLSLCPDDEKADELVFLKAESAKE